MAKMRPMTEEDYEAWLRYKLANPNFQNTSNE